MAELSTAAQCCEKWGLTSEDGISNICTTNSVTQQKLMPSPSANQILHAVIVIIIIITLSVCVSIESSDTSIIRGVAMSPTLLLLVHWARNCCR